MSSLPHGVAHGGDAVGGFEECSACGTASPCTDQGICVDPTALRLRSGASSQGQGQGGGVREAFLIEGQLVVRAPDGGWQTAVVPVDTSRPVRERGVALSDAQVTALGLPTEADEARIFFLRNQVDAVRHGDHFDFIVNGRLIHVVDDAVTDCGGDCGGAPGHNRGASLVDHGGLDLIRQRVGTGPQTASTSGQKTEFGGGRYMPLARNTPDKSTHSEGQLDHKRALADAVLLEHAGGAEPSTHTRLKVNGICCPSEVPLIHSILDKKPGIRSVKVIVPTKTVLVEHASNTISASQIVDALNAARLHASLARQKFAPTAHTAVDIGEDGVPTSVAPYEKKSAWSRVVTATKNTFPPGSLPPLTTQIACVCLAISLLSALHKSLRDTKYVAIVGIIVGLPSIAAKAFGSLRNYVVDINTLMTLSVLGACGLGYYGEGAAVVALFGVSEWLEERAMGEASVAMGAVLALRPQSARRLSSPETEVPVEDITVGETVLVRPGDQIPVDGVVTVGTSAVNEAALTGESVPVSKTPGALVFGGTTNQAGALEIRVTAISNDSAVSRLVRLVEEAQAARSNSERAVETFAKHYTPVVVLVAFLIATTPYIFANAEGPRYVYLACVLLVVACPCALVLSTPVVSVCGLTKAARRGMLIKGSAHLENLGKCAVVCVDKTGTLTEGRFALTEVLLASPVFIEGGVPRPALSAGALLRWACALETRASHPVAQAVLAGSGAAVRVAAKQCAVSDFSILPGEGAVATVDGRQIEVGGPALAKRRGWRAGDKALAKAVDSWEKGGATAVWVGVDGAVAGALRCEDSLRLTSPAATARLRGMGVEVVMLTGDNEGSALRVAALCGIAQRDTHYGMTPEQKMRFVASEVESLDKAWRADTSRFGKLRRRFVPRRALAMVGDGINDAPALGAADIGVAMGVAGAAAAMETADVALLTNDLQRLAETIELGRECVSKIRQNIAFSVIAKTLVLALSLAGVTGLAVAVVADVGTALVVILNGMTVLRSEDPGAKNHAAANADAAGEKPGSAVSGAWFFSLFGGRGRAVLRDDANVNDVNEKSIDKVGLLNASDDRVGSGDVELVETPAACEKGCCGGGGGAVKMLPFDPSRRRSPQVLPGSSTPAPEPDAAVVVAAESPPSRTST